ncbi:MAG: HDIG domain-containing protein [Fimbriimonadaceae bacterium]|nr:HDIG domain-containing protein [Fimbriimonadaceae bacterium]
MTRDAALRLMTEHTPSEALQRHMLCVEAAMRHYARKLGEDEDSWGRAGLLHDFDYEQHPDDHPLWGMALLRKMGEDEEVINAIAAHYSAKTGVHPEAPMQRYLFACDELSGFLVACVYVRPSRSILDLEVKSVIKKLKTPAFAAGVSRADVTRGADLIGVPLEEHIAEVISALRGSAESLGIAGASD